MDEFPAPEEFVSAFNRYMMLGDDDQVQVEEVERGWVRHMPDRSGRYDGRFITAKGPGPGAFEVWYLPEP